MNPQIKAAWVAKLRSGSIPQGYSSLRTDRGMCCLGVLCELHRELTNSGEWVFNIEQNIYAYLGMYDTIPDEVIGWAGLDGAHSNNPRVTIDGLVFVLSDFNDGRTGIRTLARHTFAEIASIIEERL